MRAPGRLSATRVTSGSGDSPSRIVGTRRTYRGRTTAASASLAALPGIHAQIRQPLLGVERLHLALAAVGRPGEIEQVGFDEIVEPALGVAQDVRPNGALARGT